MRKFKLAAQKQCVQWVHVEECPALLTSDLQVCMNKLRQWVYRKHIHLYSNDKRFMKTKNETYI